MVLATIDDVAKAAGVSKSTVSSVFSKKRPISKEVTEHVMKVAKEMNYRPNYWARSLVNKTTRIIGLNMRGEQKARINQFQYSLLSGILPICYEKGYRLLINSLSPAFLNQVEHMASDPVDGEIILDSVIGDSRIEDCLQRDVPIVVIGRPSDEDQSRVCYVDNDNVGIGMMATQYLISMGHRHILFLNAPENRTVAVDRKQGFLNAFEQAGLLPAPERVVHKPNPTASAVAFGYEAVLTELRANPKTTAILADTDSMALGAYQAAEELGLRIPEQLSVLSFAYDSPVAQEFTPPLTGIRIHADQLGQESILLLLEQIESGKRLAKRTLIPAELVVRGSCASPGQV